METKSMEYKSLDVFKFIFAILVVMIHTKPFMDISENVNWFISNSFLNLAVPFFFITSGFLFFEKLKRTETDKVGAVKKYILHIFKMYVVWSIIWLPLKILGWHTEGGIDSSDILGWIKIFFLTGKTGDALWYLLALVVCSIVATVVTKNGEKRFLLLLIVSIIFYSFGVLISSWYKIFENNLVVNWYYNIFITTENGLLNGLLFFTVGACVSKYGAKISLKKSSIITLILFCVLIGEVILVYSLKWNKDGVCKLFTLPIVSVFLFLTILQVSVNLDSTRCVLLRDFSTLIYVSHGIIIRSVTIFGNIINVDFLYSVLFVLTILLAISFAIVVRYFTKNKNLKILKVLY